MNTNKNGRISQKIYCFVLVSAAVSLLSACTNGPECPPPLEWEGTCTPAPQKATSRPYQIKGVWYYPQPHYEYEDEGVASYYGGTDIFHGRPTATGERFDMNEVSAAHKTVPLPCIAEVTNLENGRQLQLKVNDRGPFYNDRIIDVSRRAAQLLGFDKKGTARVRVRTLVPESLALNGIDPSNVMVAQKSKPLPKTEVASSYPRLPDSLFEEASDIAAMVVAESPSLMDNVPASSGIFVDVGEYESHTEAHTHSKKINGFDNVPIEPVKTRRAKPYAVRLGPIASMSQANQILDQLAQAGHLMSRIIIQR